MSYKPLKDKYDSVTETISDLYRVMNTPNHPDQKRAQKILDRIWSSMAKHGLQRITIPKEEPWSVS